LVLVAAVGEGGDGDDLDGETLLWNRVGVNVIITGHPEMDMIMLQCCFLKLNLHCYCMYICRYLGEIRVKK
jgi:hypothetical protein